MSGKRTKKLRKKFEEKTGFLREQMKESLYKSQWRAFKRLKKV